MRELIDNAASIPGLKAIALADHDILPPTEIKIDDAHVSPCQYAAKKGLLFLPSIEISCDTFVDDVHIIGLFCDFQTERMRRLEETIKQSKKDGYRKLCELLQKRGIDVSWDYVIETTGCDPEYIQRKHIFECIASKGYAKDWKEAKLLVRDDPTLNVRRDKPDPLDMIRLIHDSRGVAVLAHPFLIDEDIPSRNMCRSDYINMLIEHGLDGMEADYPYYKTSYKGMHSVDELAGFVLRKYAPKLKFISGGSDYHGEQPGKNPNARMLGDGRVAYRYFLKMILPLGSHAIASEVTQMLKMRKGS